jgi:hypothetical protein
VLVLVVLDRLVAELPLVVILVAVVAVVAAVLDIKITLM